MFKSSLEFFLGILKVYYWPLDLSKIDFLYVLVYKAFLHLMVLKFVRSFLYQLCRRFKIVIHTTIGKSEAFLQSSLASIIMSLSSVLFKLIKYNMFFLTLKEVMVVCLIVWIIKLHYYGCCHPCLWFFLSYFCI